MAQKQIIKLLLHLLGIIVKNCFTNNSMYGEGQTGGFIGSQISVTTSEEIKSHGRQIDDAGNSTIAAYFENCYSSGVVEGKKEIGGFVGNDAQVNRGEVGGASIYKNCYSVHFAGNYEYCINLFCRFVWRFCDDQDDCFFPI